MSHHPDAVLPLYPKDYPQVIPPEKQEVQRDGGCITNVHYPTLSLWLPTPELATGCAVVICPGGGYEVLAQDHEGQQFARWFNAIGVAAFMLKYRLPPHHRHPAPMHDVQRAMRMVRANAKPWGVKTDRIGVIGFSAGGHLASTAATHFDAGNLAAEEAVDRVSCRPDFAILAYPVVCFSRDYCHAGTQSNLLGEPLPHALVQELSNERRVTAQTPPTFLVHSSDDDVVDVRNSIDFYLACKANGLLPEMHIFPHGGHGYGLGSTNSAEAQWPALCQRWLAGMDMLKR